MVTKSHVTHTNGEHHEWWSQGWGANNPGTKLDVEGRYNTQEEATHARWQQKTADCTGIPMLALCMHYPRCMKKQCKMLGRADPCCMHWCQSFTTHCWAWRNVDIGQWMHWRVCRTIPQTLEGTQPLLLLTLLITFNHIYLHTHFSLALITREIWKIYILLRK